jgi:ABC-type nitrate/sulfonate/bicarbonate transport system permease component
MSRRRPVVGLCGMLLLMGCWQVGALAARNGDVLPGPAATAIAMRHLLEGGYAADLLATIGRALGAWLTALAVGIPIGLLLGLSRSAHDLSRGVLSFLRSLPAFMLITIPIALGIGGETARIMTISFASFLIIADETAESLLNIPMDRVDLVRVYRGGSWFILTRVLFFEAIGRTLVPVARTTVGISFVVTIVCESLVTPTHGVGARLLTSLSALDLASVYAFLLVTGLAGWLLNAAIHTASQRIVFWR